MLYSYTWNHVLLFAQMCNCDDTNETITENWVQMLENQQETIFPFTLWPLTYRTSAVIASTSLLSPSITSVFSRKGEPDQCKVVAKFYRSNEVIVICFQHLGHHETTCPQMCKFKESVKEGHGQHSSDNTHSLVPCGLLNTYARVKRRVMVELMNCREQDDGTKCIVCVGHEIGATLAIFMACDLANEFKMEADFMGLEKPAISVDCVSFSTAGVGNDTYWEEFDALVDEHVNVKHREELPVKRPKPSVFVGNKKSPLRTKPGFLMKKRKTTHGVKNVPVTTYLESIGQKIKLK